VYHRYDFYPRYVYPRVHGTYFYTPGFGIGVGLAYTYPAYRYPYGQMHYTPVDDNPADLYIGSLRLKTRPRRAEVFADESYI